MSARSRALERVVREGMAAGSLRKADPAVAAFGLLEMCFWVYRWFRPAGRSNVDEVSATFEALALWGIQRRKVELRAD